MKLPDRFGLWSITLKSGPEVTTNRSLGMKNGSIESSTAKRFLLPLKLPKTGVVSIYKSIERLTNDFMKSLLDIGSSTFPSTGFIALCIGKILFITVSDSISIGLAGKVPEYSIFAQRCWRLTFLKDLCLPLCFRGNISFTVVSNSIKYATTWGMLISSLSPRALSTLFDKDKT